MVNSTRSKATIRGAIGITVGFLIFVSSFVFVMPVYADNNSFTVEQVAKVLDRADRESSQVTMFLKATEMVSAEFDYEANKYALFKDAQASLDQGRSELTLAHESFQQSLVALRNKEPYADLLGQTESLCSGSLQEFEDARIIAATFLQVILPAISQEALEIEEEKARDTVTNARGARDSHLWPESLLLFSLQNAEDWYQLSTEILQGSSLGHFRLSKAAADRLFSAAQVLRSSFMAFLADPGYLYLGHLRLRGVGELC